MQFSCNHVDLKLQILWLLVMVSTVNNYLLFCAVLFFINWAVFFFLFWHSLSLSLAFHLSSWLQIYTVTPQRSINCTPPVSLHLSFTAQPCNTTFIVRLPVIFGQLTLSLISLAQVQYLIISYLDWLRTHYIKIKKMLDIFLCNN